MSGDRSRPAWPLSLAMVAVVAFWAVAVLPAVTLPMTDPDTWWHIRAGQDILRDGVIPSTDTWSIAGAGRSWTSQDWLSNVILALGFGIGPLGATLLSVLYGLIGLASISMLWNAIHVRRPTVGWLAPAAWLLLGLILAAPVLGVRVQVVDLFFTAAVVNVLWRYLAYRRTRTLVLLPIIAMAWVNLHAGFPMLFLLSGAVVAGEASDRWLRRDPDGDPLRWRELGWLAGTTAAAAIALVLNPNGAAIYRYPFDTLAIGALSSFVGEWQPARLGAPAGQLLAAFVVVGLLPTLLLAGRRLRIGDGLILVGLTFMAVTAVRFLLITGPVGCAVVCVALAPVISASQLGRSSARLMTRLARARRGGERVIVGALIAVLLALGLGLTALRVSPPGQEAAVAEAYPVRAVDWLEDHEVGSRIFNRFEWGGYLGLRLPQRPIFIDGRADIYGNEIILAYVDAISVTGDPQELFDQHRIDHVLYPADSTLGQWLAASPSWEEVYSDEVASVWASR